MFLLIYRMIKMYVLFKLNYMFIELMAQVEYIYEKMSLVCE